MNDFVWKTIDMNNPAISGFKYNPSLVRYLALAEDGEILCKIRNIGFDLEDGWYLHAKEGMPCAGNEYFTAEQAKAAFEKAMEREGDQTFILSVDSTNASAVGVTDEERKGRGF